MDIIINGANGRMGRILDEVVAQDGEHRVVARVDSRNVGGEGLSSLDQYDDPADVVIDFSIHTATAGVMDYCVRRGLPVVVATTGQTDEEMALIRAAAKAVPVFVSANMSIGVALLADLAARAAAAFPGADIEIVECHHNQKLDVPSGTALLLARRLQEVRPQSNLVVGRHENGKRDPADIGIHSLRYGNEVGIHEIIIATGSETVTLRHEAEHRSLFAKGAIAAAGYLVGKAPGMYDMRSMMEE